MALASTLALVVPALLTGLVAAPGCDEELPDDFANAPGGNPLVPEIALLPFPSDYYLDPDPDTVTGWRVRYPQEGLPDSVPAEIFTDADGFTMSPAILAWLPGGFDPSRLPDPGDPGATLEDDSPVLLVNAATNERVPVLVELDSNTDDVEKQTLILRAHRRLDPDTAYVVILRDALRTRDGQAHAPGEAFLALRDDRPTADPAVERMRDSFQNLVNPTLAAQGLAPEEVVLAWSFHTRSEANVTDTLLAMQQMAWEAAVGGYTIIEDGLDDNQEYRVIDGTFEAPSFRDEDGYVQLDGDGLPVRQGYEDTPFMLMIPVSVDEPRPVILYGHGFFSYYDEITYGGVNKLCRERRYSAVATNYGFNYEESGEQFMILSERLELFPRLISLHLQRLVNFTSLLKLTRETLANDITSDGPGGPFHPLDGSRIHYSGISNGGTFGFTLAATSPAVERAVLIVGGGGLTHFLQRAVNWYDYMPFFEGTWDDPLEMQLILSLMQGQLDPIDSINYAPHLIRDRFPGLPPLRASVHMAVNDSQVRNVLTEWTVRSAGIPLVTPSPKPIWGLDTVDASSLDDPELAAVFHVYDEHVEAPPQGNLPPDEDNGTHGSVPKSAPLQESWYQFIEHGRFVQVCDGACDPD